MFEDSLFASRVGVVSATKRWTLAASVALQFALAAAIITLPLLHPEALPMRGDAPKVQMPLMPRPPVRVVVTERASSSAPTSVELPSQTRRFVFPTGPIDPGPQWLANDLPLLPLGSGMASENVPSIGVGEHGPAVWVAASKSPGGPLRISTGLSEGMLVAQIRPVYPAIARAAGIQGSVVVEAVISKTGTIESLRVVSGPLMLQGAALEAIREARYRPYKLNGEAVEVQTTITVNFRIGG